MRADAALLSELLATLDARPAADPAAAVGQVWAASEVLAITIARAAMLTPEPRDTATRLARKEAAVLADGVAIRIGEALKPLAR